jgi:hypothetical protein
VMVVIKEAFPHVPAAAIPLRNSRETSRDGRWSQAGWWGHAPASIIDAGRSSANRDAQDGKLRRLRLPADAQRAVIREWLALPADERKTKEQAVAHAMRAADRFKFRY